MTNDSNKPFETVGKTIATLREKKGMSRNTLARALSMDASTIGKWESGDVLPMGTNVLKMAEVFQVQPGAILSHAPDSTSASLLDRVLAEDDGIRKAVKAMHTHMSEILERLEALDTPPAPTRVCMLNEHTITLYLSDDYRRLQDVEIKDCEDNVITLSPSAAYYVAEYGGEYPCHQGAQETMKIPVRVCQLLHDMLEDYNSASFDPLLSVVAPVREVS